VKKLLWILSVALLLGTIASPRYAKADGNPPPQCPPTSSTCQLK
jgi:hypothetical protein